MASNLLGRAVSYLLSTFYSATFYDRLLRDWRGVGFGFIVFATLFNASIYGARTYLPETALASGLKSAIQCLPDATVKGGRFSISGPVPFSEEIMKLAPPPPGVPLPATKLVVDPDYATTDEGAVKERMENEQIAVLITATRILIYRSPASALEMHDISGAPDNSFDHAKWLSIARSVRIFFWPVSMLFSIPGILGFELIAVLFFGVICNLLSYAFGVRVSSKAALRCAAAASVPACVIIELLLPVLWLKALIWLGYVLFGLWSMRRSRP